MFGSRHNRRDRVRQRPWPPAWLDVLERNVGYYRLLTPDEQAELRGQIQMFLHAKQFEGCDGLEITDEIRVTIAAQACILLLHRDTDCYPRMQTILVYPHRYVANHQQRLPDGTVLEGVHTRLGESWYRGPVVLAWDEVLRGTADIHDGHNVVFHEFAHQLDSESGATNPAEFFAVVTEAFLEQPVQLKRRHPELYDQLAAFYLQDPASRFVARKVPRNSSGPSGSG